jgi:HD-GYP domain-containing protein (c-di-GMP phosphodiesterase class II)
MPASSERDVNTERVHRVLEAMSDTIYADLASPRRTAEFCLTTVQRAIEQRNPRALWDWIDYERAVPNAEALIECLDLSVDTIIGNSLDRELVGFCEGMRRETRDYVGYHSRRTRSEAVTRNIEPIVDGILTAIHAFDPALYEHSLVVGKFAHRLADGMGLSPEVTANIAVAGQVHEIGKLRVSRKLYHKPLPLTRNEFKTLHEQIWAGEAMLRNQPLLAGIATIVAGVHDIEAGGECSDIESKVIAVADVFHTLLQARPYRKAFAPQDALKMLLGLADRFDHDVIGQLAAMFGHTENSARSA